VLQDADWGRFRSHRFSLSLPLPDGGAWRIDDHSSRWLDAWHPGTKTRVRARTWIEPRPVNHAYCAAEARRLAPDLPALDDAGKVDEYESVEMFAPDFSSRVLVGVGGADPHTEVLQGYVWVVGVAARRCAVLAFTTQAQGAKVSAVLAERLALGTRVAEETLFVSRLPEEGPLEPPVP